MLACRPVFRSKARQFSCSWERCHAALCFSEPVPQPELQCSSKVAGSPIELVCVVPEGTVASISWKKDGHPLPPEKCYLLSEKDTVLQIRNGEKSDCGSYSCNVSNVISWKEASLDLTVTGQSCPALAGPALCRVAAGPSRSVDHGLSSIFPSKEDPGLVPWVFQHFAVSWDCRSVFRGCPQRGVSLLPCLAGLTPPLRHVRRLAVVTLMFVAFPAIGFIVRLWQLREQRFGECQDCTPAPTPNPSLPTVGRAGGRKPQPSSFSRRPNSLR